MELSVKLTGNFLNKIAQAKENSLKELQGGFRDASTHLYQKSIEAAPSSTGKLRQGMRRDLDVSNLKATIYPSSEYAFYVHGPGTEGRTRPHWIPAKEAKEGGDLYRWAKKHGANPWAVRAGIAKRGTKFNPFLVKTADTEQENVLAIISSAIQNISNFLGD